MRLRVPGGRVPIRALQALSEASHRFADGDLHLTSRGNIQLRGIAPDECGAVPEPLTQAVTAAGLLPSASHERVRNIVASPLSGPTIDRDTTSALVSELDAALCADAELVDLPGRFLFGIDSGRGEIAALRCDLTAIADATTAAIMIGSRRGPTVPLPRVAETLVDLARRFLEVRSSEWNVRQLPGTGTEVGGGEEIHIPVAEPMPYGALEEAVSVLVPLGILTPGMVSALPSKGITVTPWRGLVLPAQTNVDALRTAGFVTDPDSAWQRVTACTGAPGCSLAGGDTRAEARQIVADHTVNSRIHIAGCERACGAPHSPHRLVITRRNP